MHAFLIDCPYCRGWNDPLVREQPAMADDDMADMFGARMDTHTCNRSDLLVACFAGLILWQGHGSRVMLAGLWLIPPVLLGVAATSLAVLLAAASNAWREPLPPDESDSQPTSDRWRTAVVLALFVALGLLNSRPLPTRVASGANVAPAGAAGR